ncbi:MAG TPA: Type 1 glutamine amidotransferase-like domain-containing protein [Anaerolineales bacterium]|nr:Type 1 glutamine amidotransferase-like domain-containing protein [Anaerolineales bacterium]HNN14027.1 Type 1 glutamine amidotransferase-like domain-containing protein [Anaerolineales bacterium]HNO32022.1 Type 1 glutamine amidotransferase-like domain-containing protein [Anaerolineales bacterium]
MNGLIALLGSGEYLPVMNEVDAYLLAHCGAEAGRKPRVVCLPTAAGQEGDASVNRWMRMGVEHFSRLGAEVQGVPVTDAASANDLNHAAAVEEADLVYFSGGSPAYLYQTMKDSMVWKSAQKVWARGGVYAGCSAGAMILGREVPDFRMLGSRTIPVFGLVPAAFILPHFDAIPIFGKPLVATVRKRLHAGEVMIGIDENTAIVGKLGEEWTVMGEAKAHVFTKEDSRSYAAGEKFSLGQ